MLFEDTQAKLPATHSNPDNIDNLRDHIQFLFQVTQEPPSHLTATDMYNKPLSRMPQNNRWGLDADINVIRKSGKPKGAHLLL